MRPDIVPGKTFPDYQLPDHTRTLRKLSEIQGDDPLIKIRHRTQRKRRNLSRAGQPRTPQKSMCSSQVIQISARASVGSYSARSLCSL